MKKPTCSAMVGLRSLKLAGPTRRKRTARAAIVILPRREDRSRSSSGHPAEAWESRSEALEVRSRNAVPQPFPAFDPALSSLTLTNS